MNAEIIPYLFYRDVGAMCDWLARVFGFEEVDRHVTPSGGVHAEMRFGGQLVMLGQPATGGHAGPAEATAAPPEPAWMGVFIYMDEVDEHCRAAQAAGATIEQPPHDQPYGRTYWVRDPEGHPWYFTARPASPA